MTSPARYYTEQLSKAYRYAATWPPGSTVQLGDIGVMDGHQFQAKSSITTFGVRFDIVKDAWSQNIDLQSTRALSTQTKARGELSSAIPSVPEGRAGLRIHFKREGALVIYAEGCRSERIADIVALEDEIWDLWDQQVWAEDWVVVTEVISARRGTVLVALESDGGIELEAKAGVDIPVGKGLLTGALAIRSSTGNLSLFVNRSGLTPLFRGVKIEDRFLRGPVRKEIKADEEAPSGTRRGWSRPEGKSILATVDRTY